MVWYDYTELRELEKRALLICKEHDIKTIISPFYVNFARELYNYRLNPKYKRKNYWINKVFNKWLLRGLDINVLIRLMLSQEIEIKWSLKIRVADKNEK